MSTTKLYGIKNCDTVKKALRWLESREIDYTFCDLRQNGFDTADANYWLQEVGASTLVNKRSTTWKQLSDNQKQRIENGDVVELLLEYPTLIKRPVLDQNKKITVGFNEKTYASLF